MSAVRQLFWFLIGFLAATALAAMVASGPARAQSRPVGPLPPGTTPARPASPAPVPPAPRSDDPVQGDPFADFADDARTAQAPPASNSGTLGADDGSSPDAIDDGTSPSSRVPPSDGDLAYPEEPAELRDGIVDGPEAVPADDGLDPALLDTRTRDERAVFEEPPAGYDPLLFQIEDIEPLLTDRRPARLFKLEPYDPVGIRLGSFVYFPEVEIAGVATSNAFQSTTGSPDELGRLATRSRLVSNWAVHALEFDTTGLLTFHNEFPDEDDRSWDVAARGRLDVTRQTNIQALTSHSLGQESRTEIDAGNASVRPNVTTDDAGVSLNHRFNRLSLQLRGAVTDISFEDVGDGPSQVINSDRNNTSWREAVRARWELKPTFSVFTEVGLDQRDYERPALSDGLSRSSSGERLRSGIDFGTDGEILRGEASVGWGRQTPDDARLGPVDAFLVDANVAWRVTEITSLLFTAESQIYDTTTTGSGGVVSHTVGLEARHALRRHVVATLGVSFADRDFSASPIEETDLRATLGLEYYLSREAILFGRYQHTSFDSNQTDSDWTSDEIRVGMRLRR